MEQRELKVTEGRVKILRDYFVKRYINKGLKASTLSAAASAYARWEKYVRECPEDISLIDWLKKADSKKLGKFALKYQSQIFECFGVDTGGRNKDINNPYLLILKRAGELED